ncbi:MAG TPA: hypothetical protein VGH29_02185 [Candidatus Binataceae bacterium]
MRRSLVLAAFFLTLAAIFSAAGAARAQTPDVAGLWSGTTRVTPPCSFSSGRCNAVNNVTFTLRLKGDRIKGKFTCAYGNLICRNGGADNTGKVVSGRQSGNQIRLSVVLPADVSNCYYNGMFTSADAIRGSYMCYQGGELLEEGVFDLKRASAG